MQFLRRSLTGLFLLSVTLGLLLYAATVFFDAYQDRINRETKARPTKERVIGVNSVDVAAGSAVPVISVFGAVQSRRTLEMRASASGRIVELSADFESGASVETGTLLARTDPTDAESALQVARTDVAEAEVELRDSDRNMKLVQDELQASQAQADLRTQALQRQKDLADRGVGTTAAVETAALAEASANQAVVSRRMAEAAAENRADQARSRLGRARLAVADAERDLQDTEIRAAFSGTLADVSVVEGGLVTQNERLATLIDPNALEVSFRLSTAQYVRLLDEAGDLIDAPVTATLDVLGLDLEATGRITRVGAAVGEGQTGRQLFAQLDQIAGFRPGDFVSVHVEEPELENVAVLPATAVDAANSVLAIGDENRLEVIPVEVLRQQGDDVIVVVDGIAGRRLVAERTPLVGPGILVRDMTAERDGNDTENGGAPDDADTIVLTPERRAKLIAAVEANGRMPSDAKERVLAQLKQEKVPARIVARIESRLGG